MLSPHEVHEFFTSLGIAPVRDLDAAIAALPNRELAAAWRRASAQSTSIYDRMAFEYRHAELIRLLIGSDLARVSYTAALLSDLPSLAPSSNILDIGGGPGHLALWMLRCWLSTKVTVLDRIASAVDQQWTPGLVSFGVRFLDGHLPANLAAVATEKFDRVVVAYVFSQGQLTNPGLDPRPVIRRSMSALRPLVAPGGDVIVLDHFHDRDTKLAESINTAAQRAGFGKTVKGWRLQDPEAPWQLRFVNKGSAPDP